MSVKKLSKFFWFVGIFFAAIHTSAFITFNFFPKFLIGPLGFLYEGSGIDFSYLYFRMVLFINILNPFLYFNNFLSLSAPSEAKYLNTIAQISYGAGSIIYHLLFWRVIFGLVSARIALPEERRTVNFQVLILGLIVILSMAVAFFISKKSDALANIKITKIENEANDRRRKLAEFFATGNKDLSRFCDNPGALWNFDDYRYYGESFCKFFTAYYSNTCSKLVWKTQSIRGYPAETFGKNEETLCKAFIQFSQEDRLNKDSCRYLGWIPGIFPTCTAYLGVLLQDKDLCGRNPQCLKYILSK